MVSIIFKNGKYIVDAKIHCEIDTNNIADIQNRFNSDCLYEFAEEVRRVFSMNRIIEGRVHPSDKQNDSFFNIEETALKGE